MTQAWWYLLLESSTAPTPAPAPAPAPTNYVLSPNDPTQAPPWYYYEMTVGEDTIVAANDVTLYEFNEAVTLDDDFPYVYTELDAETPATGAMRFGATVKALGRDFVAIELGAGGVRYAAIFNLATGAFDNWYQPGSYISGTSASIEEVETGIFEIEVVVPAFGPDYVYIYSVIDAEWNGHSGDIAKGLYVGGIYGYVE